MRPATTSIFAPPFPRGLPWIRTAQLRVDKQIGRPLLIAFFDVRRAVSLRPLLELQRWHEQFGPRGARIIGVHVDADAVGTTAEQVEQALDRLGVQFPVVVDEELVIAQEYGLEGIPSRYLFDQGLTLIDAHFGPGGAADGEALLEALCAHGERVLAEQAAAPEPAQPEATPQEDEACDRGGEPQEPAAPARQGRLMVRPPEAEALPEPVSDPVQWSAPSPADLLPGDYRGPYEAGGVWVTVEGSGTIALAPGGDEIAVPTSGTYLLAGDGTQHAGVIDLAITGSVHCTELQLEPGFSAS